MNYRTLLFITVISIIFSISLPALKLTEVKKYNPGPQIQVSWQDSVIANNDLIPDSSNSTHFGTVYLTAGNINTRFSIKNNGSDTLFLDGDPIVKFEGPHASDFNYSTVFDERRVVPPGTGSSFYVAFDPVGVGERIAYVVIENNDPDNNPYTFAIGGNSIKPFEDSTGIFVGLSSQIQAVGSDGSYVGSASTDWGDFDNDGDLDLALCGYANTSPHNKTKVYKNLGNNQFFDIESELIQVGRGNVEWIDYDNDNDLDLIVTGSGSHNNEFGQNAIIYENIGNDEFNEAVVLEGASFSNTSWGDFDNDGDLDLIITSNSFGNFSSLYRNDNNNTFTKLNQEYLPSSTIYSDWIDIDNDMDLDLMVSKYLGGNDYSTKLYINQGNEQFIDSGIRFPELAGNFYNFGDFDNDGDLDLLGLKKNSDTTLFRSPFIYKNLGENTFSVSEFNLEGYFYDPFELGDFNNDGDLDILSFGNSLNFNRVCNIIKNDGNGSFSIFSNLMGLSSASASFGDYDSDGDLDLITAGDYDNRPWQFIQSSMQISQVYENRIQIKNTPPKSPTNLKSELTSNTVILSWDKATDNETNQNSLTYNIYLGSEPGATDVVSPMADIQSGKRKVVKFGNAILNTSWQIKNLEYGKTYYWSVQSIDNSFEGSKFAEEQSFYLDFPPKIIDLILPIDDDTLDNYNLQFKWTKLHAYYGDTLNYNININSNVNDTTIAINNDSQYYFNGINWLIPGIEYQWYISTKYNNEEIVSADTFKFVKRKLDTGFLADSMLVFITNTKDSISYYDNNNNLLMKILWEDGVIENEIDTIKIGIKSETVLPVNKGSRNYALSKTFLIEPGNKDIINFANFFRVRLYSHSDLFELSEVYTNIEAMKIIDEQSTFFNESIFIINEEENWVEFSPYRISKGGQYFIAANRILFGNIYNDTYKPIISGIVLVPKNKTATLNAGINWISDAYSEITINGKLICKGNENNPVNLDNTRIYVRGDSNSAINKTEKLNCNWLIGDLVSINNALASIDNSQLGYISVWDNSEVKFLNSRIRESFIYNSSILFKNCTFDSSGYVSSWKSIVKVLESEFRYIDYSSTHDSSYVYFERNRINIDAPSRQYTRNSFLNYFNNRIIKAGDPDNYYDKNGLEFNSNNYVIIRNNIIKGFHNGILVGDNNEVIIVNNTFADNSSGIAVENEKDTLSIANNIFYNQRVAMNFDLSYYDSTHLAYINNNLWKEHDPEYEYSFIKNRNNSTVVVDDSSSIYADPLFINENDYNLENNSPAIDQGISVIKSFNKEFSVLDTLIVVEDEILIDDFIGANPDIGAKESGIVTRNNELKLVPKIYTLHQNYPNPFNPSTIITYSIPNDGKVKLELFNILGQKISTLINEHKFSGTYELNFNASNLPSGIYIYRIQVNNFIKSRKMMLIK